MGNIKVRGKMQRIAVIDANRVVGRAVRYSTIKDEEGNSVFTAIAGPLFLASQRHNVTRHKKSQKSQKSRVTKVTNYKTKAFFVFRTGNRWRSGGFGRA